MVSMDWSKDTKGFRSVGALG